MVLRDSIDQGCQIILNKSLSLSFCVADPFYLEENLPDELVSSNSGWSDQLSTGGGGGVSVVTTAASAGAGGPNKPPAQGPGPGVVPPQMNGAGGGGDDGSGNGGGGGAAGNQLRQMHNHHLQHLLQQQQQQGNKGAGGGMVVPGINQLGSKSPNLQSPNTGAMQVATQMGMVNSMPMSISNNGNNGMNAIPGECTLIQYNH